MNRKDVQAAIGAEHMVWNECNGNIHYTSLGNSMIPYYESFFQMKPDLNILIYSGDVDIYTVPFGFTKACLGEIVDPPVNVWQPWFVNEATAGYVESFEHYTYATIKGAGHEAPAYQPLTSLNLIQRFVLGQSIIGKQPFRDSFRMTQARVLKQYGIKV